PKPAAREIRSTKFEIRNKDNPLRGKSETRFAGSSKFEARNSKFETKNRFAGKSKLVTALPKFEARSSISFFLF
ncbi:MAG: hypothetical protein ACLFNV_09470, partial [Desulfovibrionales bacterium]